MHFIIVLTSLTTTHEAQSPIGGGSISTRVRPTRPTAVARKEGENAAIRGTTVKTPGRVGSDRPPPARRSRPEPPGQGPPRGASWLLPGRDFGGVRTRFGVR